MVANLLMFYTLSYRYQRIDELGHDFFRLQCYFVTHFIYVLSDWGRHVLERALFEEEFVFIVSNLPRVSIFISSIYFMLPCTGNLNG